jgi:hypothetical protein
LESKVEAIIRELRNILKETIVEGGKMKKIWFSKEGFFFSIDRNGNVFKFDYEFDFIGTGR